MIPTVDDTIVALSSAAPRGAGNAGLGRAILRLSGPKALALTGRALRSLPERLEAGAETRRGRQGWRRMDGEIHWRGLPVKCGVYVMPAPRSYTRQDVVELHLPAIRRCLADILDRLVRDGARLAMPGEFTRRALLNGRISLAQAEAVGALVRAESAAEARDAAGRLSGRERATRAALQKDVEELLALLELGLDFSQEDIELLPRAALNARLDRIHRSAAELCGERGGDQESGRIAAGLPRVVLWGPTNAGKSSLFNALLSREEAIVSRDLNTTRDVLRATFEPRPGVRVTLLDTAGTGRRVERCSVLDQALDATARVLSAADIVILVVDPTTGRVPAEEVGTLSERTGDHPPAACLVVWSKADIRCAEFKARVAVETVALLTQTMPGSKVGQHTVSARNGMGLAELRAAIADEGSRIMQRVASARGAGLAAVATFERQAEEALARACSASRSGVTEDAVAVDLREALHALAQADGVLLTQDAMTESVLERIFRDFCIGK